MNSCTAIAHIRVRDFANLVSGTLAQEINRDRRSCDKLRQELIAEVDIRCVGISIYLHICGSSSN